jgi:hypothetical protein
MVLATLVLLLFSLFSGFFSTVSYANSSSNAPINVSNDSGTAKYPDIANVGDNVYVTWTEGDGGIRFRASSNGGSSWTPALTAPALRISPSGGNSQYPQISADGSDVYITWSQNVGSTGLQIMEATSVNYGASFSPAKQLTTGSPSGGHITPVIASSGTNVIIAYSAGGPSYAQTSTNAGASWTAPVKVNGAHEPQDAIYGSYMYTIGDGGSVGVSSNDGKTWHFVRPTGANSTDTHEPWIAAWGSNVYVAWMTKGVDSVAYVSSSNNYGKTWKTSTLSVGDKNAWQPMIGVYGNSAWIAWHSQVGGPKAQEWVSYTSNGGATWSKPLSISGMGNDVGWPWEVATTDGNNIFIMWGELVNPSSYYWVVRASYSGNGGLTWSAPPGINVSQNPSGEAGQETDDADGAISSYGNTAFAAWGVGPYIENSPMLSPYSSDAANQIYFVSFTG